MRKAKAEGGEWGQPEKGKTRLEDRNQLAEKDCNSKQKENKICRKTRKEKTEM